MLLAGSYGAFKKRSKRVSAQRALSRRSRGHAAFRQPTRARVYLAPPTVAFGTTLSLELARTRSANCRALQLREEQKCKSGS